MYSDYIPFAALSRSFWAWAIADSEVLSPIIRASSDMRRRLSPAICVMLTLVEFCVCVFSTRKWLCACAATFYNGIIDLHQILWSKGVNNELPMTRWY